MKLSSIRHQGKRVTEGAPLVPKNVANGVQSAAAPVPGVAVGVELVAVDETGVLVALVVAVEEVGALEVAPLAPVTEAVVVAAVATVVDFVYMRKAQKKSNFFDFLASEVDDLRGTLTWIKDCKGVSKVVQQNFNISFPDLS